MITNHRNKFTGKMGDNSPGETETIPASIFSGKNTTLWKVIYLPVYRDTIPAQAQFGKWHPSYRRENSDKIFYGAQLIRNLEASVRYIMFPSVT
jgi:hypothetical protein